MATTNEPKKKKVKIKLPLTRENSADVYAAVNGESVLIKRGEFVEVDESIIEVLEAKEKMLAEAIAFEAQASANADQ